MTVLKGHESRPQPPGRKFCVSLLTKPVGPSAGRGRPGPQERQERGQDGCLAEESGVSAPRLLEGKGGDQVGPLVRWRGQV